MERRAPGHPWLTKSAAGIPAYVSVVHYNASFASQHSNDIRIVSTMAENIQEYLCGLGFKVDEQSYKRFREGLKSVRKEVIELGLAMTAAAVAVDVLVSKTARQFEGLFYASQRTGESVKNINALEYAFRMTGLSAEQARGLVEKFQTTVRLNPGQDDRLRAGCCGRFSG